MKQQRSVAALISEIPTVLTSDREDSGGNKLLPGAETLAKPLPRKRAAPTSTRARSALKPLKTLQSHLSGVLGLPRPAPNLL